MHFNNAIAVFTNYTIFDVKALGALGMVLKAGGLRKVNDIEGLFVDWMILLPRVFRKSLI